MLQSYLDRITKPWNGRFIFIFFEKNRFSFVDRKSVV